MSRLLIAADKIWAAGIVDGEGCIYIARDKGRRTYTLMIRVCMSHESTIRRLKRIFKLGSVYSFKPHKKNRKIMWNWACASGKANEILISLLPFLWTKKSEAALGISFQRYKKTLRKGIRRSLTEIRKQNRFYIALQEQK